MMRAYLHPEMIMQFPGFAGQSVGVDMIISGYKEYLDMASVDSFEPSEPHVEMIGDTAIVNYTDTMQYTMRDGKSYDVSGRELWVLRMNDQEQWQAIWRTMLETVETEVER